MFLNVQLQIMIRVPIDLSQAQTRSMAAQMGRHLTKKGAKQPKHNLKQSKSRLPCIVNSKLVNSF
jgi:hypothetical protein